MKLANKTEKRKLLIISIFSLAIVAGVAGFLVIRHRNADSETIHTPPGYVTYVQDPANSCNWKNGKIETTTLVGYLGKPPYKQIEESDEKAFINQVSALHQCWYKL